MTRLFRVPIHIVKVTYSREREAILIKVEVNFSVCVVALVITFT